MNEQTNAQLRQLLQIVGTLLTTVGVLKPGIADTWIPIIMQVVGPIMMLGSILWSLKANTPTALVASVDAMAKDPASPVKGVVVSDTAAGHELANAIPGSTTVVAGTGAAQAIATGAAS